MVYCEACDFFHSNTPSYFFFYYSIKRNEKQKKICYTDTDGFAKAIRTGNQEASKKDEAISCEARGDRLE